MEGIVFPTWASVGLTDGFAAELGRAGDRALQSLVDIRVFHNTRKMSFLYTCRTCGVTHKPERLVDDYSQCAKCQSMAITLARTLKTPKASGRDYRPVPALSAEYLDNLYETMRSNYELYFQGRFDPDDEHLFDVRGGAGRFYDACFIGGTRASADNMPLAVVRAAISVPFLWDGAFDWKGKQFRPEPGRESHLTPTIYDWVLTRG